jgi:hypothetical protein
MTYMSDAQRFRKTMAGACMIGAPALFLASSLVSPGLDADEGTAVGLIAGDATAFGTAAFLQLAGWGLFLCGVMAMMHMLREKGAREGHVGGALAVIGTLCAIAQAGFFVALWQVTKADAGAATALLAGLDGVAQAVLFFMPLGVTIGGVVLSWALYRHHFIPAWMAGLIGASAITFLIGSVTYSIELYVAASALLLAGWGAMGAMVLNETVEEWEHTPEFHGIGLGSH